MSKWQSDTSFPKGNPLVRKSGMDIHISMLV